MRGLRSFAIAALVAALLVPLPPRAASAQDQDDDQIPIQTLEVFLPIMVFDRKEEFVPDLTRNNFRIFEDGKEQVITSFDAPTQLPLHIALLVDTSNSVKRKLKFEKEAAVAFVQSILERMRDRALLASFDSVVNLHVDFTRDTGELTRSIDALKAGGNTRLYDAIYRICEEKMAQLPTQSRPVIVLITDGADVGSDRSLEEALEMAQRTNVTIFGISTRNYSDIGAGSVRGSVDKDLERICERTGGRTFLPYQRIELERAFAGISRLLRNQYVIYYQPQNQTRDGKYREIKIRLENVDGKAEVRAKAGYYAMPADADRAPR
jgi:Ca-activated chloride channel family protein